MFNSYFVLAIGGKSGPMLADEIVRREFRLLDQVHYRTGRGNWFGERSEIENGIDGHRNRIGFDCLETEGLAKNDFIPMNHNNHCPGTIASLKCGVNTDINCREL